MRVLALLLAILVVLTGTTIVNAAHSDNVDEFALAYFNAVEAKSSSFTATIESTDVDDFLTKVFQRYPVLYFYFDGYSGTIAATSSTATFRLCNVDIPWQDVFIIDSRTIMKDLIGAGLAKMESTVYCVAINGYDVSNEDINIIADEIMAEHYLAYMGYHGYSTIYYTWDSGTITRYELMFKYWDDIDLTVLKEWRNATEQQVLSLSTNLFALDMPDYQKELLIHDWLVNNNDYNINNTSDPASHMAYGALVQGTSVCQGYGEAMLLLSQAAGIPCIYVPGDGVQNAQRESHAWNCVQIDGQWYMLDITWDDPVTDGEDILRYDYFNVTSNTLAKDHDWNRSAYPECVATEMNADTVRQLCQNSTATYTQYSSELVITQEMAIAYYTGQLKHAAPIVPTVHEVSQSNEPETTVPQASTQDNTPIESQPIPESTTTSSNESEEKEGFWGVAVICVSVLSLVAILAVLWIIKRKRDAEEANRKPTTFDPTIPFEENNFRW